MRMIYDCRSNFNATMSYHPVVRLLAKLKRVDLIVHMDGGVSQDGSAGCPVMDVKAILGHATIDATELSGRLTLDGDSLFFRGPAWMLGDTSYHSVLTARRGSRPIVMRVNMFER